MAQCASTVKKVSLELGGNAPLLVFNSADINQAVTGAIASKFRNTGQTCICTNRILVQRQVHDQFVEKLVSAISQLVQGNPLDEASTQGPLINEAAAQKVARFHYDNKDAKLSYKTLILPKKIFPLNSMFVLWVWLGGESCD